MKRNKDEYNAYMKEYMLNRYHKRRAAAIEQLGGCCVKCGSDEDLQIDHKHPSKKSFDVARLHSANGKRWEAEIKKCQLLCGKCHTRKTILEMGNKIAKGNHGTISSYRYCRCDLCKAAKSNHSKKYRQRINNI